MTAMQSIPAGATVRTVRMHHPLALIAGLAFGVGALAISRSEPEGSLAGASTGSSVALAGAGCLLVACGAIAWARRPLSRFGAILAASGGAWFAVELNNPKRITIAIGA